MNYLPENKKLKEIGCGARTKILDQVSGKKGAKNKLLY
jgi:hypothetical protein